MEHPDLDVTILARTSDKAAPMTARYPTIHVVLGDLDSSLVIEEQSALADIVFSKYHFPAISVYVPI